MTDLDQAVLAYRNTPTPENKERLDAAMERQVEDFHRTQATEFVRRTA